MIEGDFQAPNCLDLQCLHQNLQFNEYGYAAAMASVLVVVLMAITVLMFLLTEGGRFTNE